MRRTLLVLGAAVLCVVLSRQAQADIVTPSSVKFTTQFGLGVIVADSLINGAGLDGVGPVEEQLHNNVAENEMWFSGCEAGELPGGLAPDCPDNIFAVGPVDEQMLEFAFDNAYNLSGALVWQYNENNPGVGPIPGRGVKSMEILVSATETGEFTSLGVFELAIATPDPTIGVATEPAQRLNLGGSASETVRRVKFNIIEAHSGVALDYVGLSEVRFDGVPSPQYVNGDCNSDGVVDIADGLAAIDRLIFGAGVPCLAACDPNGDGASDISDAVNIFNGLFLGGPAPVAPYPDCGNASTPEATSLGCATSQPNCL